MCFLGINPSLWDKADVAHWLHWAQKEYSLHRPEKGRFEMNGRALCLLTKEDFRRRCPSSGRRVCEEKEAPCRSAPNLCFHVCRLTGDVLYEILQCVKKQRCSILPQESPSVPSGAIESPFTCQINPQPPKVSQSPTGNDNQGQERWS